MSDNLAKFNECIVDQPHLHDFFLDYMSWLFNALIDTHTNQLVIFDTFNLPRIIFRSPNDEFHLPKIDYDTTGLLSRYIGSKVQTINGKDIIKHDNYLFIVNGIKSDSYGFCILHMQLLTRLETVSESHIKSGVLSLDKMNDYKTIEQRLRELDSIVGPEVSRTVRELFPELKELEKAEGRGSWVSRVSDLEHIEPPEKAPALWSEAKEPGDTPPDFIQRHYGPWLGKGLTRTDLRHLDPQLYMALANWLRKNELPEGLDLPTKREKTTADMSQLAGPESPEAEAIRRVAYRLARQRARER